MGLAAQAAGVEPAVARASPPEPVAAAVASG
jgi:hypothetical protein